MNELTGPCFLSHWCSDEIRKPLVQVACKFLLSDTTNFLTKPQLFFGNRRNKQATYPSSMQFLLPAVSTIHYSFSKKPNSSLQAILQHRRTTLLSRGIVFNMITVTTALSRFHLHKWMRRLDILEIFLSELVFSDWSRTRPSERCIRRLHGGTTCHLRWW